MITGIQKSGIYLASSQRILILDSDENNRLGLRLFLRDAAKSPELIEVQNMLDAMQVMRRNSTFDVIFLSSNTIGSSVSLYFLWLLRKMDNKPKVYLIAKNTDANSYLNHFIDAEGILMLDDPADKIRQKLHHIIRQAKRNKQ